MKTTNDKHLLIFFHSYLLFVWELCRQSIVCVCYELIRQHCARYLVTMDTKSTSESHKEQHLWTSIYTFASIAFIRITSITHFNQTIAALESVFYAFPVPTRRPIFNYSTKICATFMPNKIVFLFFSQINELFCRSPYVGSF